MWRKLNHYLWWVDNALVSQEHPEWLILLEHHRSKITFFQHERLIHLLVMLCTFTSTLSILGAAFLLQQGLLLIAFVLGLILSFAYMVHYYHLENGVQRLYQQYDDILRRVYPTHLN